MKKILFIAVALCTICLTSCSKDDDEFVNDANGFNPYTAKIAQKKLTDAGLKPKNLEGVNYIRFINDSIHTKYVGGISEGNAWFAIFDSSGEEIKSYSFPNIGSPEYCSFPFRYEMYDGLIMLTVSEKNETSRFNIQKDGLASIDIDIYSSICNNPTLYILDKNSGKTINIIAGNEGQGFFASTPNYFGNLVFDMYEEYNEHTGYFVTPNKVYFVDLEGNTKWSRKIKDEERYGVYNYNLFIDEETIIYIYSFDVYRVINVKDYELKYIIDRSKFVLKGDLLGQPNISYSEGVWVIDAGKVLYVFPEIEYVKIIDNSVTGAYHHESIIRNKYAYQLDPYNGEVTWLGKYK